MLHDIVNTWQIVQFLCEELDYHKTRPKNESINYRRRSKHVYTDMRFNPILTGGVNLTPPARNPRLPRDRRRSRRAFSWLYSFKSYASFDTSLWKSDHRSRGHVMFCTRTSVQNLPKIRILHMFVYKTHVWKLLIFLKCTITVFILSLGPFAKFSISWN